jgi:hypothetical protein
MNKREMIDEILSSEKFAVAGVSRNKNKFGSVLFKELSDRGYNSFPINPQAATVMGKECYPDIKNLPEKVDALIVAVKPVETVKLVKEAFDAGILKIWIQQGAESPEAVKFCKSSNMTCVSKECLFMYLEPVKSFHKFHRGIWKLFGKYHKKAS